ncbi:hypothetical protein STTU_0801 [Streptomyces sp. Tu6071]|nr:hypothetical protein STTU_0801 [Streptomyces sp. Tu6071]
MEEVHFKTEAIVNHNVKAVDTANDRPAKGVCVTAVIHCHKFRVLE